LVVEGDAKGAFLEGGLGREASSVVDFEECDVLGISLGKRI